MARPRERDLLLLQLLCYVNSEGTVTITLDANWHSEWTLRGGGFEAQEQGFQPNISGFAKMLKPGLVTLKTLGAVKLSYDFLYLFCHTILEGEPQIGAITLQRLCLI
jgi:hypothetical protein